MSRTEAPPISTGTEISAGIEPVRLIRGASRGFSVLAVGGAVQPLAGLVWEPLGYVWLVIVALGAFVTAAWNAHQVPTPLIQGAASALAAYALMIPLVVMGAGYLPWDQALFTTLTALAVGTGTAALRGLRAARRAERVTNSPPPVDAPHRAADEHFTAMWSATQTTNDHDHRQGR